MNWANRLTMFRIILVPVFITAILYYKLNVAFFVFLLATLTDAADGYIARKYDQKTVLGAMLDPIADKLLLSSAYISFSLVKGLPAYLKMPVYVPIIIIFRDVFILMGAMTIYFITGKLDVKPTMAGKITTFFQMITVIALLLKFIYSSWLWNFTIVLTVISGLDYLRIGSKLANER